MGKLQKGREPMPRRSEPIPTLVQQADKVKLIAERLSELPPAALDLVAEIIETVAARYDIQVQVAPDETDRMTGKDMVPVRHGALLDTFYRSKFKTVTGFAEHVASLPGGPSKATVKALFYVPGKRVSVQFARTVAEALGVEASELFESREVKP
jgi:hypothetical protein